MPLIATRLLMTNLCVLILCFDVSYVSLIMAVNDKFVC